MSHIEFRPEEKGWVLIPSREIGVCEKCHHKLTIPFFWCKQFKQAFCEDCEKAPEEHRLHGKRLCTSLELEHPHFKIIEVSKVIEGEKNE